jgi:polynucleotide 5'-kinase involved in rRNA processing
MLPLLVGAWHLVRAAQQVGAQTVVYDTSGLVDPGQGGLALKLAKIDLLRPTAVFAIQRGRELESLLVPLRRSRRVRVVDLCQAPTARRRDVLTRRAHRAAQFARYFAPGGEAAGELTVDWGRLAVFAAPRFGLNGLLALENAQGFALGLGIVRQHDARARQVRLYTPLASLEGVEALHLGDVAVDPLTFEDRPLAGERSRRGEPARL